MNLRKRPASRPGVLLALVCAATPASAAGATFTGTPPPVVVEGSGPMVWTFESDAPGTAWDHVTWALSTEPEWHMCGGSSGSVSLEGLAPGIYWVEVADEIDPASAGAEPGLLPVGRCTEPHFPALGPLSPVALSWVEVVAPAVPPPAPAEESVAATEVTATAPPGPSCPAPSFLWKRRQAAVALDRRAIARSRPGLTRQRLRHRLRADRTKLRGSRRRCP